MIDFGCNIRDNPVSTCAKFSEKIGISYPLMRMRKLTGLKHTSAVVSKKISLMCENCFKLSINTPE